MQGFNIVYNRIFSMEFDNFSLIRCLMLIRKWKSPKLPPTIRNQNPRMDYCTTTPILKCYKLTSNYKKLQTSQKQTHILKPTIIWKGFSNHFKKENQSGVNQIDCNNNCAKFYIRQTQTVSKYMI